LDLQCSVLARLWGNPSFAAECKAMVAVDVPKIAQDINKKPTEVTILHFLILSLAFPLTYPFFFV